MSPFSSWKAFPELWIHLLAKPAWSCLADTTVYLSPEKLSVSLTSDFSVLFSLLANFAEACLWKGAWKLNFLWPFINMTSFNAYTWLMVFILVWNPRVNIVFSQNLEVVFIFSSFYKSDNNKLLNPGGKSCKTIVFVFYFLQHFSLGLGSKWFFAFIFQFPYWFFFKLPF